MDASAVAVAERVSASRKLGRADAEALARAAETLIVIKGKHVQTFALRGGKPGAEAIDAMLGPTVNLRAPTLRVGTTLIVGFSEAEYQRLIASEPGSRA